MDNEKLEIIKDFVAESRDILDNLDPNLMKLEKNMEEGEPFEEIVHEIFRGFHSLKGAAGFLHMENISRLTHHAESLLDLFRKGKAELKNFHLDLFYQGGDLLKEMLNQIEECLDDETHVDEVDELINRLKACMPSKGPTPPRTASPADDLGMDENDRKMLLDECIRLLHGCSEHLQSLDQDGNEPDETLETLQRDMQGVTSQLNILGHIDLSVASRKVVELAEQLKERKTWGDKNLLGFLQRLLEGLGSAVNAIIRGSDKDYGPSLMILMDELLRLESGGTMSGESEALLGETLVGLGVINRKVLKQALEVQQKPLGEILLDMDALTEEQLEVGLQLQSRKKKEQTKAGGKPEVKANSIRVDLSKLDLLGNLVGELVIAENMVTHHESVQGETFSSFHKSALVLNRISREIQDLVMGLRMIPIQATFQKVVRVIRDLSHKVDKRVQVTLDGENTEIDKNVIENLSSPLIHIVRNAVDHGLETTEERLVAGKSEVGMIRLSAGQEGGEIVIRVADDGAGINRDKVLEKAWSKGLLPPGEEPANPNDVYNLIMLPGFSTAAKVTEVSGRGVGMDVVKSNIESMQGSIFIDSEQGVGTTFTLRIPLTLSIIEGMLVRVGKTILTVPLLNISESLVIRDQVITRAIDGQLTIKIRDKLLPILRLDDYFELESDAKELREGILVVLEYGSRQSCMFVDEILGQRQTVIKRVSNFFGDVSGVSGFSILSDGDITMVLDVGHLVNVLGRSKTSMV